MSEQWTDGKRGFWTDERLEQLVGEREDYQVSLENLYAEIETLRQQNQDLQNENASFRQFAIPCPHCPNQGWWAGMDHNTGEPIQVQCEFCWTTKNSLFNVSNELERLRQQLALANDPDAPTVAYMLGVQEERERNRHEIETLQHQLDELAKLAIRPQAQGEWELVEDSEIDDLTYVEDRVLFAETEIGTMRIDFPDGYGVCRRTEPMWLDAPDSEGDWLYTQPTKIGGEIIHMRGIVKFVRFVDQGWSKRTGLFTVDIYGVPCNYVDDLKGRKWQRLHIAWPEVSE